MVGRVYGPRPLWSDFTIKVVVLIVGKHAFQKTNMLACITASTALLCTYSSKQHTVCRLNLINFKGDHAVS